MAVFTPVSSSAAQSFLSGYDLGELVSLQGIASGIENSNFFLTSTKGEFVLTLFERLSAAQLPYYLELMRHLESKSVACAAPLPNAEGRLLGQCEGRPAALVRRLKGRDVSNAAPEHCARVGAELAKSHLAVADFGLRQPNLRGLAWWQQVLPNLWSRMPAAVVRLTQNELEAQQRFHQSASFLHLPKGAVHADLFRDNVLFEQPPSPAASNQSPVLGGFIDYYFAGDDAFLFDLAVAYNDWAHEKPANGQSMLSAYAGLKPFTPNEREAWPMMRRTAAFRFLVSRLDDWYRPRPAEMLTAKDPAYFEAILNHCRSSEAMSECLP